jgi:TrpR-related protein YerC/YecD
MRTSKDKLNAVLLNQITKTFAQVISDLKDEKEAYQFLKDFFNESELTVFSKRLAVSYYLHKKRSYENIRNNLKVSSATIAEVSSKMKSKGYNLALKKIEAEEWANIWSEKISKVWPFGIKKVAGK